MTPTGTISRDKVWKAALKVKEKQGWCIEGFNETMTSLGFRAVVEVYIPPKYDHNDTLVPTEEGKDYPCESPCCKLCWKNPRTEIAPSGYRLHYADGDLELVEMP